MFGYTLKEDGNMLPPMMHQTKYVPASECLVFGVLGRDEAIWNVRVDVRDSILQILQM